MLVLGLDTETTGLDVNKDHIIEVGAVLWDTDRKAPLVCFSSLIKGEHIGELPEIITELTGITNEDLKNYGMPIQTVFNHFKGLCERAEFVIAHNGNLFDKPIYEANCARHRLETAKIPWIDSTCDIKFPAQINTRKLSHLAAEHKFINPFAHRALFDVLTMLKVCENYDWKEIVRYSKAPTMTIRADINFHQKELAKKQNYRWDSDNKRWIKSIKDFQLDDAKKAAKEAGFAITILKGA